MNCYECLEKYPKDYCDAGGSKVSDVKINGLDLNVLLKDENFWS